MNGWILIHRQIIENKLWFSEPFTKAQAWIDLLLLANHDDEVFVAKGKSIPTKRGQMAYSVETLRLRWRWSRGKADRYLNELVLSKQIDKVNNSVTSIITILNYDKYQKRDKQSDKHMDKHSGNQSGNESDAKAGTKRITNKEIPNKETNKKSVFLKFFEDKYGIKPKQIFRDGTNIVEKKIFTWFMFEELGYDKTDCAKFFELRHDRNYVNNDGDPYTVEMYVKEILYYHGRGWLRGSSDE